MAAALMFVLASPEALPAVAPACITIIAAGLFFTKLWLGRTRTSCFEIGGVYAAVVMVYTLVPLGIFILNGMECDVGMHPRLYLDQPSPAEFGRIAWYFSLHLCTFAAVYLLVRGSCPEFRPKLRPLHGRSLLTVLGLYIAIRGFLSLVSILFQLNSFETYAESYLIYAKLPLPVAQLVNHLGRAILVLEYAVLVSMFVQFRRWRWWIAAWLLFTAATTAIQLGSRTQLMLMAISCMLAYDWLVRPIRPLAVTVIGIAVLLGFTALGYLRDGVELGEIFSRGTIGQHGNEFGAIFGNAYELHALKATGQVDLPPAAFWHCDFTSLVPQQVAPFEKLSPADWYIRTFYPYAAEMGHGFAFGAVAQSLSGWGVIDLLVRSLCMGLALGYVHRFVASRPNHYWVFVFYVWATVWVYQLFRATSFCLLTMFVYQFLPIYLVVNFFSRGRSVTRLSVAT